MSPGCARRIAVAGGGRREAQPGAIGPEEWRGICSPQGLAGTEPMTGAGGVAKCPNFYCPCLCRGGSKQHRLGIRGFEMNLIACDIRYSMKNKHREYVTGVGLV